MGCAGVNHTHVDDTDSGTGVRYYQASPYLLVNSDARGGLQWRILYLPDRTKKMQASPYAFAGRTDMTLQFRNGVLTDATSAADATEVPKALVAAVQAAASSIASSAFIARGGEVSKTVPGPYLYKIVVTGSEVAFIGGKGTADIVVPFVEPKS